MSVNGGIAFIKDRKKGEQNLSFLIFCLFFGENILTNIVMWLNKEQGKRHLKKVFYFLSKKKDINETTTNMHEIFSSSSHTAYITMIHAQKV